jgi:phosphoribosyl-ATP pyrophosphohydrolase/phosphoribosyl-AMP cyclohydrolase
VIASVAFDRDGLVPAVVQEAETGEVLMVAWMNQEALERTLKTRQTHFWSRARQALWRKGETSGHRQHVQAVYADCDGDTLLVLVRQDGAACHTGSRTCFFRRVDAGAEGEPGGVSAPPGPERLRNAGGILDVLGRVIQSRRAERRAGSYVGGLLARGDAAMAKKIGEEAAELIVAALAESRTRLVSEAADLWFHTLVLLGSRGVMPRDVLAELAGRHQPDDPAGPSPGPSESEEPAR